MIILNNKTRYDSKFLRKVLSNALRYWKKECTPLPSYLKNIRITVSTAKQDRCCTGWAWLNTNAMRLRIPHWPSSVTHSSRSLMGENYASGYKPLTLSQDLIFVFFHELMHNRGYRHANISDGYLKKVATEVPFIPWEYAPTKQEIMQLRPPKKNLQEERYIKALKMVDKWEKKSKTAASHLSQWQKKVKRYEKILSNSEEKKFKKDK
jgi:hypothetical protein